MEQIRLSRQLAVTTLLLSNWPRVTTVAYKVCIDMLSFF